MQAIYWPPPPSSSFKYWLQLYETMIFSISLNHFTKWSIFFFEFYIILLVEHYFGDYVNQVYKLMHFPNLEQLWRLTVNKKNQFIMSTLIIHDNVFFVIQWFIRDFSWHFVNRCCVRETVFILLFSKTIETLLMKSNTMKNVFLSNLNCALFRNLLSF